MTRNRLAIILILVIFIIPACEIDRNEAIESFQIHPDFQIELVAAEPVVLDPVDLEFDEHGRAFVIEMPGYPFPKEHGRVILLGDDDRDGVYEKRTVFMQGLPIANSILPYRGGLLLASPPDLLFIKDTDGDGRADVKEVLLTGFSVGNPQHNFNGLAYGLDNWIYGANGGNSGKVYWPDDDRNRIPMRGNDFRINFDNRKFERIGESSGGYGLAFDDWGRIFGTHNLEHISHLVFPGRYIEGLPVLQSSGSLDNISDHEERGLARIFPIGVQEMRVNHPEQAGYFSGACGITYYGGGSFPEEFNGNIFVADVVLNLVHRDILKLDGATFVASRGRKRVEFLASTDRAFRPVNMTVGPDGALYLLDMHRDVIEHPEWIPDQIEKNLDLDAGKDQGRIYRITPRRGLPRVTPQFDRSNLKGVVAKLGHRNKWWRDAAQRLLVQWQDKGAVEPLENLFLTSENPLARCHAMWTLHGLKQLNESILLRALNDMHPGVRENAILIAERTQADMPRVLTTVVDLAHDPDARLRMQVALTLGALGDDADYVVSDSIQEALLAIAQRDMDDPWTRMAIVSALKSHTLPMIQTFLTKQSMTESEGTRELLETLAQLVGQDNELREVAAVLQPLSTGNNLKGEVVTRTLDGLATGLEGRSTGMSGSEVSQEIKESLDRLIQSDFIPVVRAAWRVAKALGLKPTRKQQQLLQEAVKLVVDPSVVAGRRLEYLALLKFAEFSSREAVLYRLLDPQNPKELQVAAMAQLGRVTDKSVARQLLSMWKNLGPETRSQAGNILLYHADYHGLLLSALEGGDLTLGELNLHLERRRVLLHAKDSEIRRRAEALFSDAGVVTREQALKQMRPALALAGDPKKGHGVYKDLCANCHRIGNNGVDIGPNLTDIFRKSAESLLYDIVDPNAAVESQYISYMIVTSGGEIITGIVTGETDVAVSIRYAEGNERTIRRENIEEMSASGLSMMPEELEAGMEPQTMADLLAFLLLPR